MRFGMATDSGRRGTSHDLDSGIVFGLAWSRLILDGSRETTCRFPSPTLTALRRHATQRYAPIPGLHVKAL
ncbi:hypothetical protein E2C01_084088 [Portunus trituberculatus]|uniref:Uncharacterized protein n=1 Tax=Portunus trituberculatus TaxID=210409 RepID=A0A5B7J330_PORTR|nr:hypothetical protein [Portunus trituberculatus]